MENDPQFLRILEALARISTMDEVPFAKDFKKLAKLADSLPAPEKKRNQEKLSRETASNS